MVIGRREKVQLSFTNPLDVSLTRCSVGVEVAGFVAKTIIANVNPGSTCIQSFNVIPRRVGPTTLVAFFSSKELVDVKGSSKVEILKQ